MVYDKGGKLQKLSAGLLLYRITNTGVLQVLIAHMGGPFWEKKDKGAWSIPKGEYDSDESAFEAALREFEEELGSPVPKGDFLELGAVKQAGGKILTVWAVQGDLDATNTVSNTFELEWPKGSGQIKSYPEIDRAEWFDLSIAREKVLKGHIEFFDRLIYKLQMPDPGASGRPGP
jgi:predicted NUDIX family NTP pyrophosphohydrolase